MYTISDNQVTFSYTSEALQQRLQEISAQMSLTLTQPTDDLSPLDAYAITADESGLVNQLLQSSAATAAEEFDKIGQYTLTNGTHRFTAPCDDNFQRYAQQADVHLLEWLGWHTMSRWLRLRHLDQPATWTLLQATVAYSALHKALFPLRS